MFCCNCRLFRYRGLRAWATNYTSFKFRHTGLTLIDVIGSDNKDFFTQTSSDMRPQGKAHTDKSKNDNKRKDLSRTYIYGVHRRISYYYNYYNTFH